MHMDYDESMHSGAVALAEAVVGHRVTGADKIEDGYGESWALTLDNGKRVILRELAECCAGAEIEALRLIDLDHVITGVHAADGYTRWHIVAGMADALQLDVSWGEGNGYYLYGFEIIVEEVDQ